MSRAFSNNDNSIVIANSFNRTTADDESKILAWLSPIEPRARHRDIAAQRVDSIASWLLETEEFRRWHCSSRKKEYNFATLFCDGNPGVGKSYIASLVIDKPCDEAAMHHTAVTCFYFDFAARNEQSPVNMLGSLLRQLVSGLKGIPETVVQTFQNERKVIGGRGLQVSGILEMFRTIVATKRTFICIDALDECLPEHRTVVLESLRKILLASPNTRMFITGRSHVRNEVERKLDGGVTSILIQPTGEDFIRYLSEKLRNDTAPDTMSPALEADIMKGIPEISSETFLLASLHIEAILRETTITRRGKKLKSLKDGVGLGDAYSGTVERIRSQDGEKTKLALTTLAWICHAERPLLVDELRHALAVEIGETDFDADNVPSTGSLLGCCQGLITVDKGAGTVRLIHITVREYLCAHPSLFNKPHTTITEACLTYLNSKQVKEFSSDPLLDNQAMPFLKYSSRYWGTHANRESSDRARNLALQLISKYEDHVSAQSLLEQVLHPGYIGPMGNSTLFSGLHCASFFGNVELVTALLGEKCCDINQGDSVNRTPLSWAAKMGHEEVVKILLEQENIDPNCLEKSGRTPLGIAAFEGHEGVVELLLGRADVDPNRQDNELSTPLSLAAYKGYEGITNFLLGREDVDPNCPDGVGRTPLGIAAFEGHEGVVKLLLGRADVDPNRQDNKLSTPLSLAAYKGYEGISNLLLGREDVDPNHPDGVGRTPLGIAVFEGHEGVVKLLLGRVDVDPNLQDSKLSTPLSLAAYKGYEGITKLLLDREDVDPNRPDEQGRTPLVVAALHGHEGVVELLLGRENVDPGRPDNQNRTPLSWATENGHEGVVKLLRDSRGVAPNPAGVEGHEEAIKPPPWRDCVDPNHHDKNAPTPPGCAAATGHERVVKPHLGRKDVGPDGPGSHGSIPLSSAVNNGHEKVVKPLRGSRSVALNPSGVEGHEEAIKPPPWRDCVDSNHRGNNAPTPPGCAAAARHERVVKSHLGRGGVGPDEPGSQDSIPLSSAVNNGHEGVAGLLPDRERVVPDRAAESHRTPLQRTTIEEHELVTKPLRKDGIVDPSHPEGDDRTPSESAASEQNESVILPTPDRRNVTPTPPDGSYRTRGCCRCVLL